MVGRANSLVRSSVKVPVGKSHVVSRLFALPKLLFVRLLYQTGLLQLIYF